MAKNDARNMLRVQNSKEFKMLVDQSMQEMDEMTSLAVKAGMEPELAKTKVQALYLRNLQMSDDLVTTAKKNVAELMTRIQLDRVVNPDEELVSDKYIKLFKLQNEALKLIKDMEPKTIRQHVQIEDDKMVFDLRNVKDVE